MHQNILTTEQTHLLSLIQKFSQEFYLVGGTALALQYGHRRSTDFDLFSQKAFDNYDIRRMINQDNKITNVRLEAVGEITLLVDSVKIMFLYFDFPVVHTIELDKVITMPDDLTIGAMKAYAMGRRSKWKDYADLYIAVIYYIQNENYPRHTYF
ncbi:hypothetical protein COY48_01000 [Candidatus Collierbacteria bacterium CG_4_10_14_0_8_um_filter_43_86]|uniref:Nucleotidyl transferase AbiEii/AbiGii toxin family protein n=2 Tax=Candidatus Collieribacteriota TaxID=1752725 RepID=A0A2H0DT12_9BACT|nr:MAG: hypothetical protein COW83_05155 [Candidatus Collierbacteria bacterium CG22_combo_CG10-13_8_21_14_all_43_12]PIZ24799.1 MAG: hypothetical protein COY48_01000 [Candidatus Collierbacteria bacterium CG_4_10_14_0_8_um_filter_43_86]PJB47133.1 MAG: hypothetical protein CO104_04425 [Candidatus Collierbacteria bacterium CG_4_9_14_3_um_filter_43_16]